jgi:hypothetical protein
MKTNINGKEIEAKQLRFMPISDPWAEYHLEDGKVLRGKFVVTRICSTDEKAPNGQDIYTCDGQFIFVIDETDGKPN